MTETPEHDTTIDADVSGHLTTALFVSVVVVLLLVIYALASAA